MVSVDEINLLNFQNLCTLCMTVVCVYRHVFAYIICNGLWYWIVCVSVSVSVCVCVCVCVCVGVCMHSENGS